MTKHLSKYKVQWGIAQYKVPWQHQLDNFFAIILIATISLMEQVLEQIKITGSDKEKVLRTNKVDSIVDIIEDIEIA